MFRPVIPKYHEGNCFSRLLTWYHYPLHPYQSDEEYETWVNLQGKNRYLTLLGRKLTAQQDCCATKLFSRATTEHRRYPSSDRTYSPDEKKANVRACIEFSVRGTPKTVKSYKASSCSQCFTGHGLRSSKTICTAVCATFIGFDMDPPYGKRYRRTGHTGR